MRAHLKVSPLLLVDNYDSFTYNLYQLVRGLGFDCHVVRNDRHSVDELLGRRYAGVIISPGPGRPEQAGICLELLARAPIHLPILGVCLGHQAIGLAYGGSIVRARRPMHGKVSEISHRKRGIFRGLPERLRVGRYHSLIIAEAGLPRELEVTARTADGTIMAIRHRTRPVVGVQFHPESMLTPNGSKMVTNFFRKGRKCE